MYTTDYGGPDPHRPDSAAMSIASGQQYPQQAGMPGHQHPGLDMISDGRSVNSQQQVPAYHQPAIPGQGYGEEDARSAYSQAHSQGAQAAATHVYHGYNPEGMPDRRPSGAPLLENYSGQLEGNFSGPIYSNQYHSGPLQSGPLQPLLGQQQGSMAYSGPIPGNYSQAFPHPNMMSSTSFDPNATGPEHARLAVLHGMILNDLSSVRRKVVDYMESARSRSQAGSQDPMQRAQVQDALARLEQQQLALGTMLQHNGIDTQNVPPPSRAGSIAGDIPDVGGSQYYGQGEAAINTAIQRLQAQQQQMVAMMNQEGMQGDYMTIPIENTPSMAPPTDYYDAYQRGQVIEEQHDEEEEEVEEPDPYDAKPYERKTRVNWPGLIIFVLFTCAFFFYMYIRIRYTLDIGVWLWYGIIVLAGEMIGAFAVFLYAVCITVQPLDENKRRDPNRAPPKPKYRYHVRVLVPCYKESLAILQRTIMAAYNATLPPGCTRTVYLCDDGKDPKKAEWVDSLDSDDVVYVSGRKRKTAEMNGKSCNLNNCLKQIYPRTPKQGMISMREVICVLDADQVASQEFFAKTVHLLDGGSDVAMILSPQCFYNINPGADIFNNSNIHFWEYMQPGYDAMGFISCTGTNFLCRARALQECGWFPEDTVTEDFGLGIQLTKLGWSCRYVQEYLAIGEAPEEIRNTFQQRSRWCKGHFQILFSSKCPLFDRGLNMFHRVMTCASVFSYMVNCLTTPLLFIVPVVSIWFGIFPIALNFWFALGLTVYGAALALVQNYHHTFRHLKVLWFANLGNTLLWTVYFKAFFNTGIGRIWKGSITFKATTKGRGGRGPSALRDLWIHLLMFLTSLITVIVGLAGLDASINLPLVISIIFAFYNCIPYYLVLHYAYMGRKTSLKTACLVAMMLQWVLQVLAVVLVWVLLPRNYDFKRALFLSVEFFETQRSGQLPKELNPATSHIEWRSSAALLDGAISLSSDEQGAALTGGWFTTGLEGHTKYTVAIAYTVSMLCWSYTEFTGAFAAAKNKAYTLNNIKWATDYLKGAHIYDSNRGVGNTEGVVWLIGDPVDERELWMRPEDIDYERQAVIIDNGAQVFATLSAAFSSCHRALATTDQDYADDLLRRAISLYSLADFKLTDSDSNVPEERRGDIEIENEDTQNPLDISEIAYISKSYYDDMLWAASWLHLIGNDREDDIFKWMDKAESALQPARHIFNWDELFYGANMVLLQQAKGEDEVRQEIVTKFLKEWVCGEPEEIDYTTRGRAQNENEPSLASTVNMAYLAILYAKMVKGKSKQAFVGHRCWAMSQARYILGDNGRLGAPTSFLIGYGNHFPEHIYDRASSCPPQRAGDCGLTEKTSNDPNPNVLRGALIHGPSELVDTFDDLRDEDNVATLVRLDWNAAVPGLFAGLVDVGGSWAECLQGYGATKIGYHPICNPL